MDHSLAIACLKDELDNVRGNARYLAQGIAAMMLQNASGHGRVRQDVLLRWNRKLREQQASVLSLRSTIKFLELHSKDKND